MKLKAHVSRTDAESLPVSSPTLEGIVTDGLADQVMVAVRRADRRRRRQWGLGGGAVVFGIALAALLLPNNPPEAAPRERIAAMANGGATRRTLSDGSVVDLHSGAAITVAFTAEARRIELRGGNAHFQVTPDAQRPFVVTAGSVVVRAVGTGFAIQFGRDELEVIVTEGRIAVGAADVRELDAGATASRVPSSAITVDAGQRVVIPTSAAHVPQAAPHSLSSADLNDRLQWRVPRLELSGTPLADTIAAFNLYSGKRLVIGDAQLASLELSGTLRADNVDSLLRLLHDEFGVVTEQRGKDVVLRSR